MPAPGIDNRRCVLCDQCLLVNPLTERIVEAVAVETAADGAVLNHPPVGPTRSAGLYYDALVVDDSRGFAATPVSL